jgi:hypothetical protein
MLSLMYMKPPEKPCNLFLGDCGTGNYDVLSVVLI